MHHFTTDDLETATDRAIGALDVETRVDALDAARAVQTRPHRAWPCAATAIDALATWRDVMYQGFQLGIPVVDQEALDVLDDVAALVAMGYEGTAATLIAQL